ncbi:MAG: hypothetical protein MUF45_06900 [Spirosomaceae bacterium]|nr:hypothetical protein [Spirosomataceae bacterium]
MKKLVLLFLSVIAFTYTFGQSVELKPGFNALNVKVGSSSLIGTLNHTGTTGYLMWQKGGTFYGYAGMYANPANNSIDIGTNDINLTGSLNLVTMANPKMTILAGGKIGVGTVTPTAKLQIEHDGSDTDPHLKINSSGTDGQSRINWTTVENANRWVAQSDLDGATDADNYWRLEYSGTTSNSFLLNVKGDGKIGVGVSSPISTLNVAGGNWDLATGNGDFAIGNSIYKLKFGVATAGGGAGDARIYTTGGTHRTIFGANATDMMAINTTGVGIGTIEPTSKLHIDHGGSDTNPHIQIRATSSFSRINWTTTLNTNKFTAQTYLNGATLTDNYWQLEYNSTPRFYVRGDGNIGIGTTTPDNKLDVLGTIRANEVIVETGWADYVFEDSFKLKTLNEVENFIKENKHLPDVPSAKTIQENGAHVSELMTKMMQKIEELTLYSIQQQKEIEALKKKIDEK